MPDIVGPTEEEANLPDGAPPGIRGLVIVPPGAWEEFPGRIMGFWGFRAGGGS